MPFNKGDFTQQGVAGHVNAILRLNEKRYVGIDLTSDEESAGCTITGAVYDLLNEEVYPIGAGVSGNIEIAENGENINVAPYATATVNVSGGGEGLTYYTCEVTHVFPGSETIEDFLHIKVFNYLETDPDFADMLIDLPFGAYVDFKAGSPIMFAGVGGALLQSPIGETSDDPYTGVITGDNVVHHSGQTPLDPSYYEITDDGAITITWSVD